MVIAGEQAWDSKVICDPTVLTNGDRVTCGSAAAMWRSPIKTSTVKLVWATLRAARPSDMRIGITCYPTYGGSGIVATELGLELATRGHDVHFITYANPIRLDPGRRASTITKWKCPTIRCFNIRRIAWRWPRAWRKLPSLRARPAARALRDPAFHSAMLAQQMVAARRRLPFITTLHGTDITLVGMDRSYFPITKFSIEKSDGITCISQDLRRDTYEVFGVPNDIRVIYNFVNCDLYQPTREPAERRKTADPYFEFPAGEARDGLRAHSGGGAQGDAGAPVHGGRRAGPSGSRIAWRANWAWNVM